jgi:hypothetical protein
LQFRKQGSSIATQEYRIPLEFHTFKRDEVELVLWILGTLSLKFINGNTWALAALPIILVEFWHALDCGNGEDCADG